MGTLLDMCDGADQWWQGLARANNPEAALVVARALQKDGQLDAARPWLALVAVSRSQHAREVLKELLDMQVRSNGVLDAATRRVAADDRWLEGPLTSLVRDDDRWWRARAVAGDADAMACLGWAALRSRSNAGYAGDAEAWYHRAVAAGGNSALLHRLGQELRLEAPPRPPGPRPAPSLNRLRNDFDQALSQGELDKAQTILDLVRGIDEVAWQQWPKVPADTGDPVACKMEGDAAQLRGDPVAAIRWYRLGAATGAGWESTKCAEGLIRMGDRGEGRRELTRQSHCGGTAAMAGLASLLIEEQDGPTARVWLSRAVLAAKATVTASSGDVMFAFADLLETLGEAIKAKFWFEESADAYQMGGYAYLDVMQKADHWFELAAQATARAQQIG